MVVLGAWRCRDGFLRRTWKSSSKCIRITRGGCSRSCWSICWGLPDQATTSCRSTTRATRAVLMANRHRASALATPIPSNGATLRYEDRPLLRVDLALSQDDSNPNNNKVETRSFLLHLVFIPSNTHVGTAGVSEESSHYKHSPSNRKKRLIFRCLHIKSK